MGSAKLTIQEKDRSAIVPAFAGITGGIVVRANKGRVNEPVLVTSANEFKDLYGDPDSKLGVSQYSALTYLSQSDKLYVVRAAHEDAKFSGVLVRAKIPEIPTGRTDNITDEHLIVKPIDGLTQEQLDSFVFPTYLTNKEYAQTDISILENATDSDRVIVNYFGDLKVGDYVTFDAEHTLEELNNPNDSVGEDALTYNVKELRTEERVFDKISVDTAVTATKGTEILKKQDDGSFASYNPQVFIARDANNVKTLLVYDADAMAPNDTIKIGDTEVIFTKKNIYKEDTNYIVVDGKVTTTTDAKVFKVIQPEFEDRDAFLVVADNQGAWGNKISIAIAPNTQYEDKGGFDIIVYNDGVQVEKWTVSRKEVKDGFNRQMFLEHKINGKSKYIRVVDNPNCYDFETGEPKLPLFTNYILWRQNPEDVFVDTGVELNENILLGDTEVKVSNVAPFTLGTRIKFKYDDDTFSKEYKVANISGNSIYLDRPLEEDEIDRTYIDETGSEVYTEIHKFDPTLNVPEEGIVDGVQYFPIKKIDKVLYNYKIGADFVISGIAGKLLDAGANLMRGGYNGTPATVGDLITAVKLLENKDKTPISLLMDGGFAIPAYAQALVEVAEKQFTCHAYLSTDPEAERSATYKTDVVEYRNSLNLNTAYGSLFAGWVEIYDEDADKKVFVSPEAFAAASQSFTHRNYQMWYPAAGWLRGQVRALRMLQPFDEPTRDVFVDNQINPIRAKDGSGLAIWGNETLYVKPSPLQMRSVAMLLIVIKYGLEKFLDFEHFDLNNEDTYSLVEGSIKGFMEDEIKAKGGVEDFQVEVSKIVTDSDKDNRHLPIFLGIIPTSDIKTIGVDLSIFNSGVGISL